MAWHPAAQSMPGEQPLGFLPPWQLFRFPHVEGEAAAHTESCHCYRHFGQSGLVCMLTISALD